MNIEELKTGDKVWVEGIISASFSNGGVHVNHAGIDAFYDLERTKIKPDGYAEQSPKYLKNIIAKMRELPEHDRAVWIKGIFKEFGIENDISYFLGHEQVVLQAKDSLKPEIPQFVAEWLEGLKKEFPDNLPNQLYHVTRQGWGNGLEYKDSNTKEMKTLYNCGGNIKKDLVNALIYGYTVKEEKLYKVRDKRLSPNQNCLNFDKDSECWFFSNGISTLSLNVSHTRKALEESGFNVFDDYNYEVIEATE